MKKPRPMQKWLPIKFLFGLLLGGNLLAQTTSAPLATTFRRTADGNFSYSVATSTIYYFGVQQTEDLQTPFATIQLALGNPGPVFIYEPTADEKQSFLRIEGISVFAPRDSDFDGIDDVWELQHGLDPLHRADGAQANLTDPTLSNLAYYLKTQGLTPVVQFISRETSVFNFGAPTAVYEAISREISTFNFGGTFGNYDAVSREISLYNGETLPNGLLQEAYSREVSTFNYGANFGNYDAVSREVSLYNGETVPNGLLAEAYSREVSVFNFGATFGTYDAVSREVSVLNFEEP